MADELPVIVKELLISTGLHAGRKAFFRLELDSLSMSTTNSFNSSLSLLTPQVQCAWTHRFRFFPSAREMMRKTDCDRERLCGHASQWCASSYQNKKQRRCTNHEEIFIPVFDSSFG